MPNVPLDRKQILAALEEIATLLELSGANPFKSRAFRNGARALAAYEGEIDGSKAFGQRAHAPA